MHSDSAATRDYGSQGVEICAPYIIAVLEFTTLTKTILRTDYARIWKCVRWYGYCHTPPNLLNLVPTASSCWSFFAALHLSSPSRNVASILVD